MRQAQKYLWPTLTMGTCCYPDQWDESLWQSDLQSMKQADVTIIRLHGPVKLLLKGSACEGEITLPPYGVEVFAIE